MPFPPAGDLPNPGIEPMSPASPALAGRFFTTELHGKPIRQESSLYKATQVRLKAHDFEGQYHITINENLRERYDFKTLIVGAFNPFTFKVIIDRYGPVAIYLFWEAVVHIHHGILLSH